MCGCPNAGFQGKEYDLRRIQRDLEEWVKPGRYVMVRFGLTDMRHG